MKRFIYGILWLICLVVSTTFGRTIYVDVDSTNSVLPYADWKTAAANIPEAVNLAVDGDVVSVADGTYAVSDQLAMDRGVAVTSVDGPEVTTIKRKSVMSKPPFHRVVYMENSESVLDGFTISGGCLVELGNMNGAGVYVATNGGVVRNCIIEANAATMGAGGGVWCERGGILESCVVRGNGAHRVGGVHCEGGRIEKCIIEGNGCVREAGGLNCVGGARIRECRIVGNSAESAGGVWCDSGVLENCLITGNSAVLMGGGGVIFRSGLIQNCTIVKNTARGSGGGVSGCDVMRNTIVMFNSCGGGGPAQNLLSRSAGEEVLHCCIDPAPAGDGNMSKDPMFVDPKIGNFHLQKGSPCIDAGDKTGAPDHDLESNPRPVDGNADGIPAFDIGAYEFMP